MGYAGSPQDLPGLVAYVDERLRALEARFLIAGPAGATGPQGPGSAVTASWQQIGSLTVTAPMSPVASVAFPVLSPTSHHIVLFWKARTDAAVTTQAINVQMNDDTLGNYYWQILYGNNVTVAAAPGIGTTSIRAGIVPGATATAGLFGAGRMDFQNYSDSAYKFANAQSGGPNSLLAAGQVVETSTGFWVNNAPMTKIQVAPAAGGFVTGSSFWAYSVT